ncbi:sensor histidine kinase, partial [Frankia sp. CNm7]
VTDAARLRQIVDGLAENALRVVPAGAPIVLAVRAEPPAHRLGGHAGRLPAAGKPATSEPATAEPAAGDAFASGADAGVAVVEVRDGGPGLTGDDLAVAFERSALYERYRGLRPVSTGLGGARGGPPGGPRGGRPAARAPP